MFTVLCTFFFGSVVSLLGDNDTLHIVRLLMTYEHLYSRTSREKCRLSRLFFFWLAGQLRHNMASFIDETQESFDRIDNNASIGRRISIHTVMTASIR